jgi:FixJ family two-component response regulator
VTGITIAESTLPQRAVLVSTARDVQCYVMVNQKVGNLRVGLVDDDESLCRSLARLLRVAGMQPTTYLSAEAFLAEPFRSRFDCLVLDVQLPGISGVELRDRLAELGDATPVLFVSAHEDPRVRVDALAGNCAGFFCKTDPGTKLLAAIRAVAGQLPSEL